MTDRLILCCVSTSHLYSPTSVCFTFMLYVDCMLIPLVFVGAASLSALITKLCSPSQLSDSHNGDTAQVCRRPAFVRLVILDNGVWLGNNEQVYIWVRKFVLTLGATLAEPIRQRTINEKKAIEWIYMIL